MALFPVSLFVNFRENGFSEKFGIFSERENYLSEYIEAKLPQAFRPSNYKLFDTNSWISLDLIGDEFVDNPVFTMPGILIKRV